MKISNKQLHATSDVENKNTHSQFLYIAPFPPPVHGQAVASKRLFDILLEKGFTIDRADTSERGYQNKILMAVRRIFAHAVAGLKPLNLRLKVVYLTVNANAGIFLTCALCALARLFLKKIYLHHHAYSYIKTPHRGMKLLAAIGGSQTVHICICADMSHELIAQYPSVKKTINFSNIGVIDKSLLDLKVSAKTPAILGHMSNLTEEKGIGRAIAAFRKAHSLGLAEKLIVAGPAHDAYAKAQIQTASAEFGAHFQYMGPVYGQEKRNFFNAIDIFLFPSLYKIETQGIVNLEALAAGCPVIAFGRCCIPSDLSAAGIGARAVPSKDDYNSACEEFLNAYSQNPKGTSQAARDGFYKLLSKHEQQLELFLKMLEKDLAR